MKKGFTIIELLMVISIIGILTTISLPHFLRVAKGGGNKKLDYVLGSNYNKKDVEIFMRENHIDYVVDLIESEVLQERYKKWLKKELEK